MLPQATGRVLCESGSSTNYNTQWKKKRIQYCQTSKQCTAHIAHSKRNCTRQQNGFPNKSTRKCGMSARKAPLRKEHNGSCSNSTTCAHKIQASAAQNKNKWREPEDITLFEHIPRRLRRNGFLQVGKYTQARSLFLKAPLRSMEHEQ